MQQFQQYEIERVNMKLCQVMRVPADFVDVEQESEESDEFDEDDDDDDDDS